MPALLARLLPTAAVLLIVLGVLYGIARVRHSPFKLTYSGVAVLVLIALLITTIVALVMQ